MSKDHYDLVVIGAGPAGYPAAIRASQRGLSVAIIEAELMGGTCLNWGCIPTKSILSKSELYKSLKHAQELGIIEGDLTFHFPKLKEEMDRIVGSIRQSLTHLIKVNQIDIIEGWGMFDTPNSIKIKGPELKKVNFDKAVIAVGSKPRPLPMVAFDDQRILSSDSILLMKELPESLLIIGGGVIGCEFASFYADLGVEVTIVEMMDRLICLESEALSQQMEDAMTKKGVKLFTSAMVKSVSANNDGVIVDIEGQNAQKASHVLVSIGRVLNTQTIGLEKAGVYVQDNGVIPVNRSLQTNQDHIYAVGDISGHQMLAHVGTHQGVTAADHLCGHDAAVNYNAVPSVIFTTPEMASVGMNFKQAKEAGFDAAQAEVPFQVLGKCVATHHPEGHAKIIYDRKYHQVLGGEVVGYQASNLITEISLAIVNELTIESISQTIHPHPTNIEIWTEVTHLAEGLPVHMPRKERRR